MAVQETRKLPAPFIDKLGKELATQITAQAQVPVVAPGAGGITQLAGEVSCRFCKARQEAAQQFDIRQQSLAGLAPQVAGQDGLQQQAQGLAQARYRFFSTIFTNSTNTSRTAQGILGQAG